MARFYYTIDLKTVYANDVMADKVNAVPRHSGWFSNLFCIIRVPQECAAGFYLPLRRQKREAFFKILRALRAFAG